MWTALLAIAIATKPCPEAPCTGASCAALADYIAKGTITKVKRHPQGEPVFKDFAEFTLVVTSCEKGTCPREIDYRVGWCTNARTLPADPKGVFIFYGKKSDGAAQYLDFISG